MARIKKTVVSLAVAGAFAGGVSQAHASGFALIEQNASGLGLSYSGAAAAAEDASTIYYNPAGMSFLPQGMNFSAGGAYIKPSAKFSDGGTVASGTGVPSAQRPLGGDGGDAGRAALIPNLYFAMNVAPDWKIGVGLSVPFGLKTEYDPSWMGRFQAIKSEVQAMNINPAVSYKVNEKMSLAAGLNYQRLDAELSNAVNFVAATFGATGSALAAGAVAAAGPEGTATVKGDDTSWGWNLGAMFQMSPETRLGLSYRSPIKYKVQGTVTYSGVPTATMSGISPALAAAFQTANVSLDIKLPDTFSAALSHKIDEKWTILGDLTWTGWSSIKELRVTRDSNGSTLSNTPENFKDTWRYGVGAVYKMSDPWSLKMGIAYDQSPVNDTDRTARLPDNDRTWLSFGGQYHMSKTSNLDIGFAHLFVKNTTINQNGGSTAANGQLVGTYKSNINILGVQYSAQF